MFNFLKTIAEKLKIDRAAKSHKHDADDIQWPLDARKRRRLEIAKRRRQQRKGQRVYTRDQLRKAYEADTLRAQLRVLQELPAEHPMHQNVKRSIEWKQAHAAKVRRQALSR